MESTKNTSLQTFLQRAFLIRLSEEGRLIRNMSGWYLLIPGPKDVDERQCLLPVWRHSGCQVHLSCCSVPPWPLSEPTSSGFQLRLRTNSSPAILQAFSSRLGPPRHPALWTEPLLESLASVRLISLSGREMGCQAPPPWGLCQGIQHGKRMGQVPVRVFQRLIECIHLYILEDHL